MIEATPHPGYQPRSAEARFLTKARGKLWIDEQDHLAARVEAEFIDDVNFGAFLAKLHERLALPLRPGAGKPARSGCPAMWRAASRMRILLAHRHEILDVGYNDYRRSSRPNPTSSQPSRKRKP